MRYKQQYDSFVKVNHDGTITIPKKYADMLRLSRHSKLIIHVDRQSNSLHLYSKNK